MPHTGKLSINKGTGPATHEMSDVENSRFQVNKVGTLDVDDGGDVHDGLSPNQYTYVYDTRYAKSLGQLTREALPNLNNYRDLASVHAQPRPTLDELHNATYMEKVSNNFQLFSQLLCLSLSALLLLLLHVAGNRFMTHYYLNVWHVRSSHLLYRGMFEICVCAVSFQHFCVPIKR